MTEIYNVLTNIPRRWSWSSVLHTAAGLLDHRHSHVRHRLDRHSQVRAQQGLTIRDAEYNVASRCLGTPLHRIVLMNILPYLVSIVIMQVR
jgi:oligopeptide transport system permease protein